jgi:hypothetical protein
MLLPKLSVGFVAVLVVSKVAEFVTHMHPGGRLMHETVTETTNYLLSATSASMQGQGWADRAALSGWFPKPT